MHTQYPTFSNGELKGLWRIRTSTRYDALTYGG